MAGYNEDAFEAVCQQLNLSWDEIDEFRQAVHDAKASSGRYGDDNLTYEELLSIAIDECGFGY